MMKIIKKLFVCTVTLVLFIGVMSLTTHAETPEEKTTPIFTYYRVTGMTEWVEFVNGQGSLPKITSDTTIIIAIENGEFDETDLKVFVGDIPVYVNNNFNGVFDFTLSPYPEYRHPKIFLYANNKWGNTDEVTLTMTCENCRECGCFICYAAGKCEDCNVCKVNEEPVVIIQEPVVIIEEPAVIIQEPEEIIEEPEELIEEPEEIIEEPEEIIEEAEEFIETTDTISEHAEETEDINPKNGVVAVIVAVIVVILSGGVITVIIWRKKISNKEISE